MERRERGSGPAGRDRARSLGAPRTAIAAWTLAALSAQLGGCPADQVEAIPCNRSADCPAGETCDDGLCRPRADAAQVGDGALPDHPLVDGGATDAPTSWDAVVGDGSRADASAADVDTSDGATADAAPTDAGLGDARAPDGGAQDLAAPDTAAPDTAAPDTAAPDSAASDGAERDSAAPDSAVPDAATPDTATPDASLPDTAPADSSVPDAAFIDGGWWSPDWRYRRQLTFDNRDQDEDLLDFPVLVQLDDGLLDFSHAQAAGEDVRFVDADDQTPLSHEIEAWTAATAAVWVKVPAVDGASNDDYIWMYYGNPSAADGQEPAAVWSNGYLGVWHLNGGFADSTQQANHGLASGPGSADGRIAQGALFDGDDDYVDLGPHTSVDNVFGGGATVEAWIFPTGWGGADYGRILDKSTDVFGRHGWALELDNDTWPATLRFERDFSIERGAWVASSHAIALDRWQHVCLTYDDGAVASAPRLYLDGDRATLTRDSTPAGSAEDDSAQVLRLGNFTQAPVRSFDGTIDEVRISSVLRSSAWVAAQYRSMTGDFVALEGEQSLE